jgi:aminoglycoside 2''-phosphotransferase
MKELAPSMSKLTAFLQKIQAYYPEIQPKEMRLSNDGQFSDVLILDEALVFRFPRSIQVAKDLAKEIPLLDALQGKLPLAIPNPRYHAYEPVSGDTLFMGYPMIAGEPLMQDLFQSLEDTDVLAQELAGFLRVMHGLKLNFLEKPPANNRHFWQNLYDDFIRDLFPYMRPDAQNQVRETFEQALNDAVFWQFEPILVHGDFGTGNILYNRGHITGIIDFSFCGLGDPAQDLGALKASYGQDFIERILVYYPGLAAALPRLAFITSTYALQQALYALRDGNKADFEDGISDYV